MRKAAAWTPAAVLAGLVGVGGCETKGFIDPTEMMRTNKAQLTNPILTSIAQGLDEAEPEYTAATDVRQEDLIAVEKDYVIGKNDLISISVTDVAGPGVESVKTTRVTESGNISLPLIGQVKASGLTEAELEKAVAQVYRDKAIIQNAQVSVTVLEQRQRTFSILGAVNRPGQFQIVQSDFRMIDALTVAGDVPIQGIEYIYIIRKNPKNESTTKPSDPATKPGDPLKKPVDPLEGKTGLGPVRSQPVARAAGVDRPVHLAMFQDAPAKPAPGEGPRRVMVDGKWVDVPAAPGTATAPAKPPVTSDPLVTPAAPVTPPVVTPEVRVETPSAAPTTTPPGSFEFEAPKADSDTRIIRVPLERLQKLELQYNVVIRANDTIIVPGPKVGEYYMGGHVQRTGVYSLTGRNITLKQAIISAGMLDPLAWPERTEVIRRIGKDRELFVRVDLPKIFAGEQPDFYLRPYDTVNVGTNMLAPFLASVRGAFRFTYGFGFIYDRNFYDVNQNLR